MKALFVSFAISCCWHSIFLFFICSKLPDVEMYKYNPKIRFLGELFQSINPRLKGADVNREMGFLDAVFSLDGNLAMQKPESITISIPRPFKTTELSLKLCEKLLDKKENLAEYNLLSKNLQSNLIGDIQLDEYSNPLMVKSQFITGELKQDFKIWFQLKKQIFYSPIKKYISLN
ncbi:MAG: hypothetical protein P9M06_01800 [Candidatus Saelkia tenebricola]|nr:hypothetical protein [Candidatus Saelkia tenebricola]